jgi:predicted small lipoprotein YifL
MSPIRTTLALLMTLMLLAGCGKKGDLYHPSRDRSPPPATEQPAEPAQELPPPSMPGY